MSILIVQLPPRARFSAHTPETVEPGPRRTSDEYSYALSLDGLTATSHGECTAVNLPQANSVVLVLSDADVSWHPITLPKAPQTRLRAALAGVLEEALLDDVENVHLALEPQAAPGKPVWVAAVGRAWLSNELSALEKANVFVDRVVPISWPDTPPLGHFSQASSGATGALELTWSHADGVTPLSLQGGLARSLLSQPAPTGTRWSASPAVASAAQQWLGNPVTALSNAQRALQATRSLWNLRQFELARRSRGTRALRDSLRQFLSPAWRPVRYGIIALILTQIVGLNLWAWHLRAALVEKRAAQVALLQATYPHVRAVLDAPLQMQRETAALKARSGKPNAGDFELLLQAAASAWPLDSPAVASLLYEPGHLKLATAGWNAAQIEQFTRRLRPAGVQVEALDASVMLTHRSRREAGS